jgi:mediator of RNA polymerase II transcription subunit 7
MTEPHTSEGALAITNTLFPPPPAYFKAFTDENLARYAELGGPSRLPYKSSEKTGTQSPSSVPNPEEAQNSTSEQELAGVEAQLGPPRSDWVKEEGAWKCFGETHHVSCISLGAIYSLHPQVEPFVHSAESLGLPPYVDPDEPPQTSLPPLLHSFLHTLLLLVDTLTNTARIPGELEMRGWKHEGDQVSCFLVGNSLALRYEGDGLSK